MKYISLAMVLAISFLGCGSGGGSDSVDDGLNKHIEKEKDTQKDKNKNEEFEDDHPNVELKQSKVNISEILPRNLQTILDPDFYNFSDYIELHNTTDAMIDIGNYYLSDSTKDKKKWKIPPNTTIQPNGYIMIWADKEDTKLHTNFALSNKREVVTLSDLNGEVIDMISYTKAKKDIAMMRKNKSVVYMTPSPMGKNNPSTANPIFSKDPILSKSSGFYDNSVSISITQEDNAKIYYTTDGTTPTKNSQLYNTFIDLNSTTTIKTRSYKDGEFASDVVVGSYIINHQSKDPKLPVVSISMDEKYLYDDEIGIYVKGTNGVGLTQCIYDPSPIGNFARDWERPAHIEYFDTNREKMFDFDADVSLAGQCSRTRSQKSLKIDLNKKYGVKSIKYKLYKSKNISKFKDFKLRVGYEGFYILDMLGALVIKSGNLDVDYQAYQLTKIYLNGEYWGVYNMRETKGKDFISSNYPDVDDDELDIIDRSLVAKKGDMREFDKLTSFVNSNDLAINQNYETISNMVDIDNLIDYMIVMIYSANPDWIARNTRCWREKKEDAKWRWIVDDLDMGFGMYEIDKNFFDVAQGDYEVKGEKRSSTLSDLFKKLLLNSEFKTKFKSRFDSLLDLLFTPTNMDKLVRNLVDSRAVHMKSEEQIRMNDFVNDKLKGFINNRSSIIKDELKQLQ